MSQICLVTESATVHCIRVSLEQTYTEDCVAAELGYLWTAFNIQALQFTQK